MLVYINFYYSLEDICYTEADATQITSSMAADREQLGPITQKVTDDA